mgnify:CR=1 FL=1
MVVVVTILVGIVVVDIIVADIIVADIIVVAIIVVDIIVEVMQGLIILIPMDIIAMEVSLKVTLKVLDLELYGVF